MFTDMLDIENERKMMKFRDSMKIGTIDQDSN